MLRNMRIVIPRLQIAPGKCTTILGSTFHAGDFTGQGVEVEYPLPGLDMNGLGPAALPVLSSHVAELAKVIMSTKCDSACNSNNNTLQLCRERFLLKSPGSI